MIDASKTTDPNPAPAIRDAAWLAARATKEGQCPTCDVPMVLLAPRDDETDLFFKGKDPNAALPMRYACPKCEVFEIFCYDNDANLWAYQARDSEHSDWAWLPAWMRRPCIDAEFGIEDMHSGVVRPLDVDGIRWWFKRGTILSTLVPASDGAEASRADLNKAIGDRIALVSDTAIYGYAYPNLDLGMVGEDVYVLPHFITLVHALYPGCQWKTGRPLDPAAAIVDGKVVALVMPQKPADITPRCPAKHVYQDDRVGQSYGCDLSIYHEGPIHSCSGLTWDERECPRTEVTGPIDNRTDKSTPFWFEEAEE